MADQPSDISGSSRMSEHAGVLKDDLKQTGQHLRQGASDIAGQAVETAKQYGKQGYDYATDKVGAVKESTEGFVKENPWMAIGLALGTGLLLGLILRGRSRE